MSIRELAEAREPPFDPEYDAREDTLSKAAPDLTKTAERALLGHLLTTPSLAADVAAEIDGRDFADPAHELIWDTIHALATQGVTPDHLTVLTHLDHTGQLRQAHGHGYLLQLRDAVDLVADPLTSIATIRDAARLRTIGQVATRLRQLESTGDPDRIDTILGDALQTIADAAMRVGPASPASVSSWAALDLTPVLAGGEVDPPPSMLARTDGQHLLYDGAVHSISGEPTSGKTWVALLAATQELAAGHTVVMLDFEDRASRVVGRLLALGAHPDTVREHFHYIRPHTALDATGRGALEPSLTGASLVIVDGVTEAMTLHGLDLSSNTDVAAFLGLIPRWIADHGAAVLLIDHVVKDTEKQGRWAIGGQHKLAGLDGVAYTIKAIEQFGRGKVGHARITAGKDRAGHVEEHLIGRVAGELWIDSRNETCLIADVRPAQETPKDEAGNMRPTYLMERVSRYVEINPGASRNSIETIVKGKRDYIRIAVELLTNEGYINAEPGPRRSTTYTHITAFRDADEDTE